MEITHRTVPGSSISIEDAIERFPTLRQSLLATSDECMLRMLFELRYSNGWSTTPQARGTLAHRAIAEILRTMQMQDSNTIPIPVALEILLDVARQRDVPPEEIVRVPLRELADIRMAIVKFARDNSFTVRNIVDIERQLQAPVRYDLPNGRVVTRMITGKIDALIAAPPDGCIVLDWKTGWGMPVMPRSSKEVTDKRRKEGDVDELSYEGFFQLRTYAFLVLSNYPSLQSVTLREFYPYRTLARKATVYRKDLHRIERELAILAEAFDLAIAAGSPKQPYRLGKMGHWQPTPGKHCDWCLLPGRCPIESDARGEGAIANAAQAAKYAAEMQVAQKVYKHRREALKAWYDRHGPIPVKWSKGRRVLGWVKRGTTRAFTFYVPDDTDRSSLPEDSAYLGQLESAMREATQRAREERDKR